MKPWLGFRTSPRQPPCHPVPVEVSQEVDGYRDVRCASWRTAPLTALSCCIAELWIGSEEIKVTSASVSVAALNLGFIWHYDLLTYSLIIKPEICKIIVADHGLTDSLKALLSYSWVTLLACCLVRNTNWILTIKDSVWVFV